MSWQGCNCANKANQAWQCLQPSLSFSLSLSLSPSLCRSLFSLALSFSFCLSLPLPLTRGPKRFESSRRLLRARHGHSFLGGCSHHCCAERYLAMPTHTPPPPLPAPIPHPPQAFEKYSNNHSALAKQEMANPHLSTWIVYCYWGVGWLWLLWVRVGGLVEYCSVPYRRSGTFLVLNGVAAKWLRKAVCRCLVKRNGDLHISTKPTTTPKLQSYTSEASIT